MRVVFVHGRAQEGRDPVALQAEWEQAWEAGLQRAGLSRPPGVTVAFPYYGDALDRLRAEVGMGVAGGDPTLLMELAVAYGTQAGLTNEQVDAEVRPGPLAAGPQNNPWVLALLRLLEPTLGAPAVRQLHDVWAYLTLPQVQREIDRIVAEQLAGADVIVAHSLGTVVAYNVLRAPGAPPIPRLVTLGSPLGVAPVVDRLQPLRPLTLDWFDARDPRDVVALNPLTPAHFPIPAPVITRTDAVRNETPNCHGIAGYLSDPEVARRLRAALTG